MSMYYEYNLKLKNQLVFSLPNKKATTKLIYEKIEDEILKSEHLLKALYKHLSTQTSQICDDHS